MCSHSICTICRYVLVCGLDCKHIPKSLIHSLRNKPLHKCSTTHTWLPVKFTTMFEIPQMLSEQCVCPSVSLHWCVRVILYIMHTCTFSLVNYCVRDVLLALLITNCMVTSIVWFGSRSCCSRQWPRPQLPLLAWPSTSPRCGSLPRVHCTCSIPSQNNPCSLSTPATSGYPIYLHCQQISLPQD